MAITLNEHAESRRIALTTAGEGQRLRWHARGSTDQAAIKAALLAAAPATWDGLTFVGADATPYPGGGHWDCTADYAYSPEEAQGVKALTEPTATDPLGPEFEFDLTAQTAHITQSVRTVTSRYDANEGGLNAPQWLATTAYTVGATVLNGNYIYMCVTAGTSAGSGGPTGSGTAIVDGTVEWDYVEDALDNTVEVWTNATAYSVGDRVDSHGYLYECSDAGTSAATGDGPEGTGTAIVDGTVEWDYVSPDLDEAAPDFAGAIAVTRDRVVGTDVYVGHLEFCITAQYYPVTLTLLETLLSLVGSFNAATWYSFPPKTLLYLGCTGAPRPGDIWTLKHRFAAAKNLRNIPVGSRITIPFKGGWDFLWACYRDAVVTAKGRTFNVQVPYSAYVEQTCQASDFTQLPII